MLQVDPNSGQALIVNALPITAIFSPAAKPLNSAARPRPASGLCRRRLPRFRVRRRLSAETRVPAGHCLSDRDRKKPELGFPFLMAIAGVPPRRSNGAYASKLRLHLIGGASIQA